VAADAYERGRPDYPQDAIDWLAERLGLGPGVTVVDLAAGTGKLTRQLVPTGATLIAVEPLAEMRAKLEEALPGVETFAGTAESMPLSEGSADAVTVAQAFHWFDVEPALAEIHRVLRPGGSLALIWNSRSVDDPLHAAIDELLAPYRQETPTERERRWRGAFDSSELFGPLEERTFSHVQRVDRQGLSDRFGSVSFIAALPDDERAALLEKLVGLAGENDVVDLPYNTDAFVATRT
jgi:SAM-dependent methyltransferase